MAFIPVYYDLEGGGGKDPEIVQIGAMSSTNQSFNVYIMPKYGITRYACEYANGLSVSGGHLYKHGSYVPSVSLQEALNQFYGYLSQLNSRVILVAHGGDAYDHRLLVRDLQTLNLKFAFDRIVIGYADSLKILQGLGVFNTSLNLDNLARHVLGEQVSHDALSDATQLKRIMELKVSSSAIQSYAKTY